jgi:hypothetical protein
MSFTAFITYYNLALFIIFLFTVVSLHKSVILSTVGIVFFMIFAMFTSIYFYYNTGYANNELALSSKNWLKVGEYFDDEKMTAYYLTKQLPDNRIKLFSRKFEDKKEYDREKSTVQENSKDDGGYSVWTYNTEKNKLELKLHNLPDVIKK